MIVSVGIFASFSDTVQLMERIRPLLPSRRRIARFIKLGAYYGLIGGLIVGIMGAMLFGLSAGLNNALSGDTNLAAHLLTYVLLAILLGGIIGSLVGIPTGGMVGSIYAFLDTPAVDERPKPGEGLRASIRIALLMTLLATLLFSLISWILDQLLKIEIIGFLILANFLPPIFIWFGGLAWFQHWSLRFII